MTLGPLELIVLSFPQTRLNEGISATLDRMAGAENMRVIDVLVVRTDFAGGACTVELGDLTGLRHDPAALSRLATGLISEADVDEVAWLVDSETDVLVVLVELLWINELAGRVAAAQGRVVARMPAQALQAVHPQTPSETSGMW